jgi:hypothetical protein
MISTNLKTLIPMNIKTSKFNLETQKTCIPRNLENQKLRQLESPKPQNFDTSKPWKPETLKLEMFYVEGSLTLILYLSIDWVKFNMMRFYE